MNRSELFCLYQIHASEKRSIGWQHEMNLGAVISAVNSSDASVIELFSPMPNPAQKFPQSGVCF
jgi:hypothetical protein